MRRTRRAAGARVLVVDDDTSTRRVLMTTLRLEGYEPVEAANGLDGLTMAREVRPDVIVLDVLMPGLDGFEVCRRLRDDPLLGHTKVVMLTAHAGSANVVRSHALGADAYLVKPFDTERLVAQIRALLGQSCFQR